MKKEINRCMGCMSEKLYNGPCEICGYIDNEDYPAGCLAPKTLLVDRYVIGKLISKGGEGCVYLAYDTAEDHPVEIKEFLPDTLCRRAADGETVEVMEGCLPLYKSYLSEFADLHKTIIAEISDSSIKREYEIFSAGNTGYIVTEHPEGMSFGEYLTEHGGRITWEEAKKLLPPLLETLGRIHEKGIVHRGISPETLFVTNDGRLILTSVDISAARTAESQINCEMFPGYAACEQYDLSERQGTWTDIYGISAVLYRALTGTVPPDASKRKEEDTLVPAITADSTIPPFVSDAISDGMKTDPTGRIPTVGELSERLMADSVRGVQPAVKGGHVGDDGPITPRVAVFPEPERYHREVRKPQTQTPAKKKKKKQAQSNFGMIAGLIIFFALVIALVIAIIYFSDEARRIADNPVTAVSTEAPSESEINIDDEPSNTTADTSAPVTAATSASSQSVGEMLVMPDFVNRFFNTALQSRYSMLVFETEYDYSGDLAEGLIYEQDIAAGTPVSSGTTVKLKVSKGPAYTYLPDYIGMKLSEYTTKLTQLGITFETEEEETGEVKAGYVVRCSKEIGDQVMISEKEVITVYYAKTPAKTTPETEAPEEDIEYVDEDDDEEDEIEQEIPAE